MHPFALTRITKSLTQGQQNLILTAAIMASSMAFIDGTALNVALPALQRSLGLDGSQMLWVVNAYTLFLASLILIGGSLGDIFGKRRMFTLGIGLFTGFSMLCGLANSGSFLIISRALQGVGGALMLPGSLSIITASFPRETRGKAIGTWSMVSALTTILGPVLGGYLAGEGLWRAIFFINVPLGLASILILWLKVPEPVKPKAQRLDWKGGFLATLAFSGITYGFIEASEKGFGDWFIWFALVVGIIALAAFLVLESRASQPMLPLGLFKSPTFSGANAMTLFVYGALGAVLFFVPLNLIQIQGYPEKIAGLAILPFGGTIALLSRISGRWTDKTGAKIPLIVGPVITGIGFFGFSLIGITSGPGEFWSSFFPPLLLGGIGMGLTVVPLTTAVMNCVTEDNSGIASGVNNTMARLANVLALAVIGALALLQFQDSMQVRLHSSELSTEQMQYMEQQAEKLAEAEPAADWPEAQKEQVQTMIKSSFIAVFDFTAYVSAGLCFMGAILSWMFIKGKPKKVKLD